MRGDPQLCTAAQLADLLGLDPSDVMDALREGAVESRPLADGRPGFDPLDVMRRSTRLVISAAARRRRSSTTA